MDKECYVTAQKVCKKLRQYQGISNGCFAITLSVNDLKLLDPVNRK